MAEVSWFWSLVRLFASHFLPFTLCLFFLILFSVFFFQPYKFLWRREEYAFVQLSTIVLKTIWLCLLVI
jgi:hypothetical protein